MSDTKIRITISAAAKGLHGTFSKSSKALKAFRGEMGRTQKAAMSLNSGLKMALGGLGLGMVVRSLFDVGVKIQALDVSFQSISGSAAAAKDELNFVREVSNRLGQEFYSTAAAYKEIFAAAIGTTSQGKTVRDIFTGITEAATALHMAAPQVQSSLYAIGQMISKGTVQSQELRLQLGNQLPGAFNIAAKAMGLTTRELDKMMSTGKLMTADFLPKFARVLHERFGKAALEAADTAQAALNRFKTAWIDLKGALSNAGFLDQAVGYLKSMTAAMKDPAVQTAVKNYAKQFFDLIAAITKFIAQHGKLIATLAAAGIVILRLIKVWQGLNAAMLVMTGLKMVPWLAAVNLGLSGIFGTTLTVAGAFFTAATGLAALYGGYKLGEWLTMRKSMADIADETKRLNHYTSDTSRKFVEISKATGITITSMYDLDQAIKDNKIHYDDLTGTWKAGSAEQTKAVSDSAAAQQQITGKALAEMKKKYRVYVDEIKKIIGEIAVRQRSLIEELRAMSRTGMSDLGAWRDRKKEAEEYYRAAQKAAAAGNFKAAISLADKAKSAYKDLNKEVKAGDKVQVSAATGLKTAMDGVKSAGELAIAILKKQKTAAEKAAKAMDDKAGGKLSGKIKDQLDKVDKFMQGESVNWGKVWQAMNQDAAEKTKIGMQKVDREIMKIVRKNRVIYIDVVKRERKSLGGIVSRLAMGGRLAGYGGGDRIPALLEAGEFIMRKESVRHFGAGIFRALNNLQLPELPKFAAGGQVAPNVTENSAGAVTINFSFPSGAVVGPFRGTRALIRELDRERRSMALGASA